jgi:hypothetical protein
VITVRPNRTKLTLLTSAVELLREANATAFDIVLVGARRRWLVGRKKPQRPKTIEITISATGSPNARNGKRKPADFDDRPWGAPLVPSLSANRK